MKAAARKLAVIPILLFAFQSCATSHLISWGTGHASIWRQPAEEDAQFIRPLGSFVAFPVVFAWDVVTFPFQWLWDVHPYGAEYSPHNQETLTADGYFDPGAEQKKPN